MNNIFELIAKTDKEEEKRKEVLLGIRVKLSSHEAICSVTQPCKSYQGLENEVREIKQSLDEILKNAKEFFEGSSRKEKLGLSADMKPEEIWSILSAVPEEKDFIGAFNAQEEGKRREVAEHVLTHCNVFSGKAAVFSSRYDDKSALME